MTAVKTLIQRARYLLHDLDEVTYDDTEIVEHINNGIRLLGRSVASIRPEFLETEEIEGTLSVGENTIHLEGKPMLILSVRTKEDGRNGSRLLAETGLLHIDDTERLGTPEVYCLMGTREIRVYPVPARLLQYKVHIVKDLIEVTKEDESPLPTELDDLLVEYVNLRLMITDEYDTTQDFTLYSNIHSQVLNLLRVPPAGVQLRGYWDARSSPLGRSRGRW